MSIAVRPVSPSEAPTLATFAEACFREAFGNAFPAEALDRLCGRVFEVPVMETLIAQGVWLAEAGSAWAGYVALGSTPCPLGGLTEPNAELARLYVPLGHQGTGVADALMDRFLEELRMRDVRSVWLQASADSPRALAFYRRRGFEDFGAYLVTCEGVALPHRALGRNL